MAETIAGGYFLGADGKPHDANGNPVKPLSDEALKQARDKSDDLTPAQREAIAPKKAEKK